MGSESRKYLALAIVVILSLFLFYVALPFLNAFFGALILYVLFLPLYIFMVRHRFNRKVAALIIIIISLLIIIIPLGFAFNRVFSEVRLIMGYQDKIIGAFKDIDAHYPQLHLKESLTTQLSQIGDYFSRLLVSTIQGFSHAAISLVMLYFILFYLLLNFDKVEKKIIDLLPFNRKNSKKLVFELHNVTYATVISTGLIAVIQGVLLALGFVFFGMKDAFLWGFLGAILSFLPIVGIPLLWIPASLYLVLQGNYLAAGGMFIWGIIISNVDNFIRPAIQKKVGRMHPLTTIIGIFIGVPFFGLLGLVVGPLLLSYFLLTANMFKEEYY